MAQTMQSISHTFIEKAKSQYTASSLISAHLEAPKTKDTISLLFTIGDSLNNLYLSLEKLYHVTKMTNLEMRIITKYKEQGK